MLKDFVQQRQIEVIQLPAAATLLSTMETVGVVNIPGMKATSLRNAAGNSLILIQSSGEQLLLVS